MRIRIWKRGVLVPFVLLLAVCLAGCCGPREREETMPTVEVPPEPVVEEEEEFYFEEEEEEYEEEEPVIEEDSEEAAEILEDPREAGALRTVFFDFDKSNLKAPARAKLDKTAEWLLSNPEMSIRIDGHCDERGTNEYNIALGERRAYSAKRYLVNQGVSSERLKTRSYGEERPVDPGHNEDAWAKNRRSEFKILE